VTVAFAVLVLVTIVDLAWVMLRVRREWSDGDELTPPSAVGISSLYLLGAALVAAAVIERPWPIAVPLSVAAAFGGGLIASGALLVVGGARPFGSVPRLYGVERGGLIEGGVYRFSRNPQYAGLILAVAGIAVAARSTLTLAVAGFVGGALWLWVVAIEEPHLATVFGSRYKHYRARVPRFLGFSPSSST
jgi:protein-S-isoprenylcysteine O-methyltransferase Ste14